jgi:ABC-type antimicrobial peptide transport system permease subunit
MNKQKRNTKYSVNTIQSALRVGFLLARRQITRGNFWINTLIIGIMTLTFLSLVVISGILVGLLEGSFQANRQQYTGDVIMTPLSDESSIIATGQILSVLDFLPQVRDYTVRYKAGATIEANFLQRRDFSGLPNSVGVNVVGIEPEREDRVTELSELVIEGEMLESGESGYILLGSTFIDRYSGFSDLFEPLQDVYPGDRVRVSVTGQGVDLNRDFSQFGGGFTAGRNTQDFIVKGIVQSKVNEVSVAAFITDADHRRLTRNTNLRAQEIAIVRNPNTSDDGLKSILTSYGFDALAKIQTATEAIPKFLDDIRQTFSILGSAIGGIGLIVSAITIFIVIYINALTRRKFIGILKGIGISGLSVEFAYVLQSVFYVVVGSAIGAAIVYFLLVPVIAANPINFPFSDGILVADPIPTLNRFFILFFVTTIAGYIPARLIIKKNTLDSILQR